MLPPEVPGLPFVGNALAYGQGQLDWLTEASRRGPCVRIRFFHQPYLLVSEPALIEEVLVTKGKLFQKDLFARGLRPVLGDGLLTAEGETWRRHRRLINPFFTRDRVDRWVATMRRVVERRLIAGEVDLAALSTQITLDIVLATLFGDAPLDPLRVSEPLAALMEWYTQPLPLLFPTLGKLPLPSNRRFFRAIAAIAAVLGELIAHRRRNPSDDDLLGALLAARDEDSGPLTDKQVRDELATFLLAGHETTASALTFALWRLGRDPALQKSSLVPSVLRESMRLHPPVWSLGREASVDTTLGGSTDSPRFDVPRGTQLWFVQWAVHRDPRFFEDPETFRPARWSEPSSRPKLAYFPFGAGARQCVGMHFALVEAETALTTIVEKMTIEALDARIEVVPAVTLRPRRSVRARLFLR